MLLHLNAGRADNTFERRLAGYVRPDLLVGKALFHDPVHPEGTFGKCPLSIF